MQGDKAWRATVVDGEEIGEREYATHWYTNSYKKVGQKLEAVFPDGSIEFIPGMFVTEDNINDAMPKFIKPVADVFADCQIPAGGSIAQIHSLKQASELNSTFCRLIRYIEESSRWECEVEDGRTVNL